MAKKKVKTNNQKNVSVIIWCYIAIISMIVYIGWRFLVTIPDHNQFGWLATICGIILAVCEAISMFEGVEHIFHTRKKALPDRPEGIPYEEYPHVDVLIATHNEEEELLYKTVNGCLHMQYPDKSKVHIYLCDDGDRREIEALAARMGVGYFGLSGNTKAKSGNLNNALSKTDSPWVVTFDADMIPTRKFLMEVVPYTFLDTYIQDEETGKWRKRTEEEIDENYKIGFIQTPQSFYSADLFQYNFFSENRMPNEQDFFFREINVGRNTSNAPIYAGSNTIISRRALNDVGGIAEDTITEDFETGINIQKQGYRCYATDKALAHGMVPTDFDGLLKQRIRWGRGCISSLRRVHLILTPKLKASTKLSYLSCLFYWDTFFRRLVFILAPIIFVLFRIPIVICDLKQLLLFWLPSYLLYNHALKVASSHIRNAQWSNIFDTIFFPYMIGPLLMEKLFIRQKKFHVTSKTRAASEKSDFVLAVPHLFLLVFDVLAFVIVLKETLLVGNYGAIVILYWLLVNGFNLLMAVMFMLGRKNYRIADRFPCRIPVNVEYASRKHAAVAADISEGGMALVSEQPIYISHSADNPAILELSEDPYEATVRGYCVHVAEKEDGWHYGIAVLPPEGKDKAQYLQMVFDRDPGLAEKMSVTSNMLTDIYNSIEHRVRPEEKNFRHLPRVAVGSELKTSAGKTVTIRDCNFEFVTLDGVAEENEISLLFLDGKYSMDCVLVSKERALYKVTNVVELNAKGAFDKWLRAAPAAVEEKV